MATQLILTVGTNALPVWVAWYHLKNELEPPITVRFVYTADTKPQKDLLKIHCGGATFGQHIQTSPGDLGTVRGDIKREILKGLEDHLHVHYTGGTKVMGVETVSAIESELPGNIRMDTTYLDPRGNAGPRIVSRSRVLVKDARQGVAVNLNRIALLNGFTLGSFVHEYYTEEGWVSECCPTPTRLNPEQQQIGENVLNDMKTRRHLAGIRKSQHFEWAAYIALKKALARIERCNPTRKNYAIFNRVYVRQTGAKIRDPIFELDVVVVLGYQVVLVTCTLLSGKKPIKMKGMEGIERVQQLGGDEAQVVVLCKAHQDITQNVQKEFYRPGSNSTPVKVWGTDKWANLPGEFEKYLRNTLHWM